MKKFSEFVQEQDLYEDLVGTDGQGNTNIQATGKSKRALDLYNQSTQVQQSLPRIRAQFYNVLNMMHDAGLPYRDAMRILMQLRKEWATEKQDQNKDPNQQQPGMNPNTMQPTRMQ